MLSKESEREVDIMDITVDEDTTRKLCVRDEESGWVQLVKGLRAEDTSSTDRTGVDTIPRVTVRGIKTVGKSTEGFEMRFRICGINHALGLF